MLNSNKIKQKRKIKKRYGYTAIWTQYLDMP